MESERPLGFVAGSGSEVALRSASLQEPGLGSYRSAGISSVDGVPRLDEESLALLFSIGVALDPTRHDEDLAWLEFDVAIPQIDRQPAAEDQKLRQTGERRRHPPQRPLIVGFCDAAAGRIGTP
jgi:hypothetical protein